MVRGAVRGLPPVEPPAAFLPTLLGTPALALTDETEVVAGTITEVREDGAVLFLREPDQEQRWILAVPHEPGWGLQALWFSFIAVDAFELDGRERLGRWFIRLG